VPATPCSPRALLSTVALVLALSGPGISRAAEALNPAGPANAPPSAGELASADKGFSYFIGLARQNIHYRETGATLPFQSDARSGSALLVTGALYAVNPQLLLSLDAETTFYPGDTTEQWTARSDSFGGVALSSRLLQTNGFNLAQSRTQLLGHYRLQQPWFGLGGLAMHTQSFRRYSFKAGPDDAVATPSGTTVEESTAEVLLNLGVGLESEQVRGEANHYGVRATLGVPLWRRLRNTTVPGVQFDGRSGVDLALEGRYSWAVHRNIHIGLWGQWLLSQRGQQAVDRVEVPKSRFDSLSYGLELLWKL